jgi:hypothetical protein
MLQIWVIPFWQVPVESQVPAVTQLVPPLHAEPASSTGCTHTPPVLQTSEVHGFPSSGQGVPEASAG